MTIPKYTREIFELLGKGQFICSNSNQDNLRKIYNNVEEYFDELYDYFFAIGFILEKGDEYFYFSRTETKAELERKIEQAFKWIDLVDFCKTFDNSFSSGFRFTASQMEVQLRMDVSLKDKLETLKRYTSEGPYQERVKKLIELLCKDGYVELENDIQQQYKVLSSFKYLEQLILSIHISEEVQNEIPQ
jgi:hypothetical protein